MGNKEESEGEEVLYNSMQQPVEVKEMSCGSFPSDVSL